MSATTILALIGGYLVFVACVLALLTIPKRSDEAADRQHRDVARQRTRFRRRKRAARKAGPRSGDTELREGSGRLAESELDTRRRA
jgi:hypothetical protein